MNTHQQVTSTEEDFNNQMGAVTCFVNNSQPLFPALFAQGTHEQSDHDPSDGDCTWAQQHGLPRLTWLGSLLSVPFASAEVNTWVPNMAPFHEMIS
jgi:hypothetical protein